MTEEQIRQKYVEDYTKQEQLRRGIDCHRLKSELRAFLESKVAPIMSAREPGKNWDQVVSEELKQQMASHREFLFTCLRLYEVGDSGRRNALEDLAFAADVHRDFIVMDILLRMGGPGQSCDATCLDAKFREFQLSYEQVLKRLG